MVGSRIQSKIVFGAWQMHSDSSTIHAVCWEGVCGIMCLFARCGGKVLGGLGLRVVSGVLLLTLVLVAIWQGGLLLMGLVALATALAAHEFYTMVRRAGYRPLYQAGVALALLLALRAYLAGDLGVGRASAAP